ncbi:5-oxoprolinase subunit PxpB [Paenibacillus phoenicis]|uniref:5-oxoprolinase subunit PxpB n=1 Tax=Paenibacillus phoenicis TaxID=554117 RepID=A0ABU5PI07_9BACL|nr:5-oxoprolinase subunit PxpB [Paenibacillus phoenicis]MEA3569511.1 5-oxoprolinase subunit PxpB [Paenibacillus phoenicis]
MDMTFSPSPAEFPVITPLGDSALIVTFGDSIQKSTHVKVRKLAEHLEHHPFPWMIETVPAFTSVTIYYDVMKLLEEAEKQEDQARTLTPYQLAEELVTELLHTLRDVNASPARIIEIPVCYGGEWGPDLETVAFRNGLTPQDVINIHTSADYLVYMLGFAPGFAYLGGMSKLIATPRRETPRLSIPAGTVGIAGDQTGVYPIDTPGGWQLIGKTPIELFKPQQMPPTLLQAGDIVRFYSITREQFEAWEELER